MEWHIISCDNSKHIVAAQKYLLDKYAPGADIRYIDVGSEPVEVWTHNVLKRLDTGAEHIILGLDDFLPIDHFPELPNLPLSFDRIELGWGGSRKGIAAGGYRLYADDELYRVSCQFSIWRTEALKELLSVCRSPWKFETKGTLPGYVMGLEMPWRYIEESAISGRQQGKVNLCGLRQGDIDELVAFGMVRQKDIVYGWAGTHERTKESYGTKYADYF